MSTDPKRFVSTAAGIVSANQATLDFELDAIFESPNPDLKRIYDLAPQFALLPDLEWQALCGKIRRKFPKDIRITELRVEVKLHREKLRLAGEIDRPTRAEWESALITTITGAPKPCLANARIALLGAEEWRNVVAFDEFAVRPTKIGRPPWGGSLGWWTDDDDILTADWLQHNDINVNSMVAAQAIQTVSKESAFHPVRDWLDTLKWDGVPRIDKWLPQYFGSQDSVYSRAVGAKWLISAVARVRQPGCQADHCLILEGEQGIRKSTALRTMGGKWFTDDIEDIGSKDSQMQVHGVWIVELAELDAMRKSDSSRVKSFLGRREDHFRPPYGKRTEDFPRQCVFAGSTNQSTYLNDETGARRFWPVTCYRIDLDALVRDCEQIWAEAVVRFDDGDSWWLESGEAMMQAKDQQDGRYQRDAWDGVIWSWMQAQATDWDDQEEYRARIEKRQAEPWSVSVEDVLGACLQIKIEYWSPLYRNRVAAIFTAHGMERFRETNSRSGFRYRRKG